MSHTLQWSLLAEAFSRLGRPVAVVDLESTGGNFYQDRITEVAILRFENGVAQRFEWLVNPEQPISDFIVRLTGIDDDLVANEPVFADLIPDLLPLLRGAIVVAHNSRFDYTFLRHEFQRAGIDFAAPALCTVQLSRRLYPEFYKHNLDSIIERCGIQVENRHRAMTDVLALADFLELSLKEKGQTEWDNQVRYLMNPKMLPTWLPDTLAQQLYDLPDSDGMIVWQDKFGQALKVESYERAYSEIATLLNSKRIPAFVQAAVKIVFTRTAGSLHSLVLKAQAMQKYGLRPSENVRPYLTVNFVPEEHGRLQARIVPLNNGVRVQQPYGLFIHKKAAKRALAAWAAAYGLCPSSLNILPSGFVQNVPCPVAAVGKCHSGCQSVEGIDAQNRKILEVAHLLPVDGWGKVHEMEITESDDFGHLRVTTHCVGGALQLADGRWYFDERLPAVLKAKIKERENVNVLA